jgi:hypothetical protein
MSRGFLARKLQFRLMMIVKSPRRATFGAAAADFRAIRVP